VSAQQKDTNSKFIAGGTNQIDLMKRYVSNPEKLIDINNLPLKYIEHNNGKLRIGALALNGEVSDHPLVKEKLPLLSDALAAGASAQLRNMATVGGNMLQRTRCPYFYDTTLPCNKREPGSGCGALEGFNRMHAIFGFSEKCIAVHPSDMSVALTALEATVNVSGPKGDRTIPFTDFHRLPGDTPHIDTNLGYGELITGIEVADNPYNRNFSYLKVRDRASYAFALVSVAAGLHIEGGRIKSARLALGGVAHKPWRLKEVENWLAGKTVSEETFKQAGVLAMQGSKGFQYNKFKLKLTPASIVEALITASGKV
jgi:xanthine dehydrogenase YagS FAD-binding subunit